MPLSRRRGNEEIPQNFLPGIIDLTDETEDNVGSVDRLQFVTVRGQRVAKACRIFGFSREHHPRGDQADQAAA